MTVVQFEAFDRRSWLLTLVCALALLISPLAASSATFVVTDGGLGLGWACETSNAGPGCASQSNFAVVPVGPTTGTITYAGGMSDLDIALTLHSATLSGSFGAVTDIVFTNVSLTNTQTAFEPLPNTIQGLGSAGAVAGTYELFGAGGSSIGGPQAFSLSNILYSNVSCLILNPSGQCGFTIGGGNNLVLDINGTDHTFDLTFNVVAPEPGTAALLGLGLIGLAIRRRG